MIQKNNEIKIKHDDNESQKKNLNIEKTKSSNVQEDIKEQDKKASKILSLTSGC